MTSAANKAWLKHKARPSLLATIENLKRAHGLPYALPARHVRPRRGMSVVIGSGPSLDRTAHLAAEWQQKGATLFTTNTGLPALARRGIVPDVVVVREVVGVGDHLEHKAGTICLDLAAAPSVWDAAIASGNRVEWFVGGALQYFDLAVKLGVRPLFGGGAALTGAVALAEECSAASIVLLGVDLAFADDGLGYAEGSAWGGYRGKVDDGFVCISGKGYEVMRAQSDRGGIPAPPSVQQVASVVAYGGVGEVKQLLTWADQREWLETFAARRGDSLVLENATGSGARIEGWHECTPDMYGYRQTIAPRLQELVSEEATARALDDIVRQVCTVSSMAGTLADPDGCVAAVPGWLDSNAIVEAVAAPDIVEQHERRLPAKQAIKAQSEALQAAAERVLSVVR